MNAGRGILIAGNWKMNHSLKETVRFFEDFENLASKELSPETCKTATSLVNQKRLQICVIPPYLALEKAQSLIQGRSSQRTIGIRGNPPENSLSFLIQIGAQNAHWEKSGAFTGEVSGPMLQEIGVQWVLVGHSERRQFFGETDSQVRKRSESLLKQGFKVILCFGETKQEREANQTNPVLARQLKEGLPELSETLMENLVLAYEPVWAIGTGLTATPEMAEEAHSFVREEISRRLGDKISNQISILYGGSVTPQNIRSLLSCPNIDGALVGGASLKPESFLMLVQAGIQILSR